MSASDYEDWVERDRLEAENTKLRAELAAAKLVAQDNLNWFNALKADFDAARAELAAAWGDAYALIEKYAPEQDDLLDAVRARIDAALKKGGRE